jgi:hypothetical protein
MSLLKKKPKEKTKSRLAGVLSHDERMPLMLRICDECYAALTISIANADQHNLVAVHCPHYSVLMEVALIDGDPIGVVMTGPITEEEAKAKIDGEFDFNSLGQNQNMQ